MTTTNTDAVPSLLPCPFCGGHAEIETIEKDCFGVGCPNCDFQLMNGPWAIGWHRSKLSAATEWNCRPAAGVQAEAVTAWQPIETAPKIGRTLLLGYPNSAGKWRTVRGQWMSEAYIEQNWEEPDDVEPGWFETSVEAEDVPNCWPISPTHWMPLPAAPASSAGDQEVGS
ncbi:hypothetical protein [Paraburkholderia sp. RL17-373-BIF-A]|uniref:hypothetical protein n=1 Tax=Paraburkholderia sp. RL17-373-BIF-A TaxID=3031629 RepID=UPI0038B7B07E